MNSFPCTLQTEAAVDKARSRFQEAVARACPPPWLPQRMTATEGEPEGEPRPFSAEIANQRTAAFLDKVFGPGPDAGPQRRILPRGRQRYGSSGKYFEPQHTQEDHNYETDYNQDHDHER